MNHIQKIRNEIRNFFDPSHLAEGSQEIYFSPNEKYRLETSNYWQSKEDLNWDVTKVEIFDNQSNEKLFEFFGNDGHFFHAWITKNDIDYLICAEDLFGGQTVIDLTHHQMESFSPDEDGFIWTNFYLSPDGNKLATIGCYWACPYVIKVYNFKSPMKLPTIISSDSPDK